MKTFRDEFFQNKTLLRGQTYIDCEFRNCTNKGATVKGKKTIWESDHTKRGGVWEDGTFDCGTWVNGDWQKGQWKGGLWKYGKEELGRMVPGKMEYGLQTVQ